MSAPALHIEQASNSSLWDRVSTWVSENKAVAYTIAGTVVVVTAGGVVYYLSDSNKKSSASTEKKKSKKERRKEKKQAEEAAAAQPRSGIQLQDEEAGMMRWLTEINDEYRLMMALQLYHHKSHRRSSNSRPRLPV